MRNITGIGAVALLQVGLHACSQGPNVPGTDTYIEAAEGHGQMTALRLEPAEATVEVSAAQAFEAIGVFEDGFEVAISDEVWWEVADRAVATKADAFEGGALAITGAKEGETAVTVDIGDFVASASLTVIPASLVQIDLAAPETSIGKWATAEVRAVGTFRDGSSRDVSAEVEWSTSDSAVAVASARGVRGVAAGEATVTATLDDITASQDFSVFCQYPVETPRVVQHYETLPYMRWETAQDERGRVVPFDLEEVHCGQGDWAGTETIVFLLSSEWCPFCPDRMRWLNGMASTLEERGMQIVYMDLEDRAGRANMSSADTAAHVNGVIPGGPGLRIGDLDTRPTPNLINQSRPFVRAFPTVFVVRVSDMKIIANQMDGDFLLDLPAIAENPDWIWRDPDNPVPAFVSNCPEGAEEPYEPNDTPGEAPTVGPMMTEGGICAEGADFYRVNISGRWRASLVFEHDVGDLDVYVWNEFANAPLRIGGEPVGSASTTNNESFEHEGEALLRVEGKRNASAPYTLFIEEL